jgi:signal transduction histidine kinase
MVGLRPVVVLVTSVLAAMVFAMLGLVAKLAMTMHRASESVAAAVESVHLAEGAEVDLILHEESNDRLVRLHLQGELRRKLSAASRYVRTPSQVEVLGQAARAVEEYVRLSDSSATAAAARDTFELAKGSLAALAQLNLEESRAAQDQAARRKGLVMGAGAVVSLGLLLFVATFLWWLSARAFRPLFALAESMDQYAAGARSARAAEAGAREIRHMAHRFNELADALEKQRQAQFAFLGGVAHDLKTPLSALKLSVSWVGTDGPLPSEARVRRTLRLVDKQVGRLEGMVGDLLDRVTLEAGELRMRFQTQDARELVLEAAQLFSASSSFHRLELDVARHALPIRADSLRLIQVLNNLLSNALKYSPEGGAVRLQARAEGRSVVISVQDFGIGISEADLAHIFDPFQRAGAVRATEIPGVGLGLFVARRIIEAHEGRIEVRSVLGHGTTFEVWLPFAVSAEQGEHPSQGEAPLTAH